MVRFDIRGHAVAYEHNLPFNRDDRRVALDLPIESGVCYTASLEDLVVSKLCSQREHDELDIREPALVAVVDWDKLDSVAQEMPMNCLNERVLGDFRLAYDRYVKECGPCAR